jgi:hypothetical protein
MKTVTADPLIPFLIRNIADAPTRADAVALASGWTPRTLDAVIAYLVTTGRATGGILRKPEAIVTAVIGPSRDDLALEAAAVHDGVRPGGDARLAEIRAAWRAAKP